MRPSARDESAFVSKIGPEPQLLQSDFRAVGAAEAEIQ
jgi:hypothetical protein